MKNFLLTTLVLVLVPTIIFVPVYALLIYNFKVNVKDYFNDVQGRWNALQYYYENQRVACDEDVWMLITFDEDAILVDGTILPEIESTCIWNGSSLSYEVDGATTTFLLSFDSNNNLKIVVDDTPYIIILRKSEA